MADITYELDFMFDSGEELKYVDTERTFFILDNYSSKVLLTPQLFGIDDERDYFSLLVIDGIYNLTAENYRNFKNFGDQVIEHLNNSDKIAKIIIKETDTDNIYYSIDADHLVGIEAGGASDRGAHNKLVYRLQFYYKKGE